MNVDAALAALKPRLNQAVAESSFLACQEAAASGASEEEKAEMLKAYVGAWGVIEAVLDGKDPRPVLKAVRAGKAPSEVNVQDPGSA